MSKEPLGPSDIDVPEGRERSAAQSVGRLVRLRASKSALNMIMKSAAIELRRNRPQAICVALHPGTVDTALSKPFQTRVPANRLFTVEYSADRLLAVLAQLGADDTGEIFAWDGDRIQP